MTHQFSSLDCQMMKEALIEACKARDLHEVPVGAILASEGKIIARAHNLVESQRDATAHAEMLCMRKAAAAFQSWRLLNTTLYITLEPCVMCAGAILLSRISRVVWGAADPRQGAHGSWIDLFEKKHPMHRLKIVGGLYGLRAAELMRLFFQKQRSVVWRASN